MYIPLHIPCISDEFVLALDNNNDVPDARQLSIAELDTLADLIAKARARQDAANTHPLFRLPATVWPKIVEPADDVAAALAVQEVASICGKSQGFISSAPIQKWVTIQKNIRTYIGFA